MIHHIKSLNKDYNIFLLFLYLSENCNRKKKLKIKEQSNINIKNILCKDISRVCVGNDENSSENEK